MIQLRANQVSIAWKSGMPRSQRIDEVQPLDDTYDAGDLLASLKGRNDKLSTPCCRHGIRSFM